MSIHTRMKPRSEREKDLLKYGRRQGREQVIEVAKEWLEFDGDPESLIAFLSDKDWYIEGSPTWFEKVGSKAVKRAERRARKQMRDDILYLIARDFVRCETCPECATPVEVMRHLKHELQAVKAGKKL